ncbi:MAG TPA: hypothetical protein VFS00_15005, partial [Polyangiaceae bacterium]|nr:hypothetical protein [Polyangiaceae bacterium]
MKTNALVGGKLLWVALVGALAASAGGCAGADGEGGDEGAAEASAGLAMEADVVANDLGPDNVQKK